MTDIQLNLATWESTFANNVNALLAMYRDAVFKPGSSRNKEFDTVTPEIMDKYTDGTIVSEGSAVATLVDQELDGVALFLDPKDKATYFTMRQNSGVVELSGHKAYSAEMELPSKTIEVEVGNMKSYGVWIAFEADGKLLRYQVDPEGRLLNHAVYRNGTIHKDQRAELQHGYAERQKGHEGSVLMHFAYAQNREGELIHHIDGVVDMLSVIGARARDIEYTDSDVSYTTAQAEGFSRMLSEMRETLVKMADRAVEVKVSGTPEKAPSLVNLIYAR